MSVARCRSFWAPVEISPSAISSAVRPAEQHRQLAQQIVPRHQVAILERQLHRVAERAEAALHDRDLVHRIEARQHGRDDRVARFVIRDDLALLRAHDALLLETRDQPIDRRLEVLRPDRGLVVARREQRRLVDEVREIGAGKSGGARRDDPAGPRRATTFTPFAWMRRISSRPLTSGLSTSTWRSKRPGRSSAGSSTSGRFVARHDDDALARVEPVHLGEQLVERLLALLVAADRALHARLAERVELVDEDDARRLGFGLLEEIANAGGADADEHLDELRSAQAEERHVRFAGDRARQQRLAGSRRADEQHALRDAAAEVGVLLRGLQELDDFLQLVLGLVDARDIREPHLHFVVGVGLGAAARERHHAAFGAAHPAEEEAPDADEEDERE